MVARGEALANYQERFSVGTDAFVRPAGEAHAQAASDESTLHGAETRRCKSRRFSAEIRQKENWGFSPRETELKRQSCVGEQAREAAKESDRHIKKGQDSLISLGQRRHGHD